MAFAVIFGFIIVPALIKWLSGELSSENYDYYGS